MKQTYSVIIRKEHCIGKDYFATRNCPLCNAIRQQLPEFKLQSVGGNYVRDTNDEKWSFNSNMWYRSTMKEIIDGIIDSCVVEFSKEISNVVPKTERIVYVSVPETISKQTKELILS